MFKAARIAKIKEIILDRGKIDVSTLSSLLGVSEVTIRSDLDLLEQERFIVRSHGGAILNEDVVKQHDMVSSLFQVEYDRSKEDIGHIAADMVSPDEWIYIGQGSTCCFVAQALLEKPHVNVVTNNLLAAAILTRNSSAQIIMIGGELAHDSLHTTGDIFASSFENLFVNKAFVSISGVSMTSGLTVANASELSLFRLLKKVSDELIIVADSKKFGSTAFRKIGNIDFADTIITNEDIDEVYKSYCFENNVKLFTSYQIKKSDIGTGNKI